ncbi:hypothetical protein [Microcoleus sp. MON2_D5]
MVWLALQVLVNRASIFLTNYDRTLADRCQAVRLTAIGQASVRLSV